MELKFKAWDSHLNQMITNLEEHHIILDDSGTLKIGVFDVDEDYYELTPLLFTNFKDCDKTDIYDGDILSDEITTDEGPKFSLLQVFWFKEKGCWHVDMSSGQNKSYSYPLSNELKQYKYKIVGNIYENPGLLNRKP